MAARLRRRVFLLGLGFFSSGAGWDSLHRLGFRDKYKRRRHQAIDGEVPFLEVDLQITSTIAMSKTRFDLYFRRNPFGGECTVFAGREECIKLIANFRFAEDEISFFKSSLHTSCKEFSGVGGLTDSEDLETNV